MIDKDFSTVDMIFVPVNVKNNHWSLVVVNTKTFVLKLYDSLFRIEEIAGYMELLQMFELFMRTWFIENKNLPTTWKSEIAFDIPQQTNSYDLEFFCLGKSTNYHKTAIV
jgi:Ulp1 family protease